MRLAEAEQRGRRDRRVVEADDALEMRAGVGEVARGQQVAAALGAASGATSRVSGPGRFGVRSAGVGGRASSIGPDDTRLAHVRTVHPAAAGVGAGRDLRGRAARRRSRAGTTTSPRPTRPLVVVQREERRAVTAYRWGLIPHWATEAKVGSRMFNARAETITTQPGLPRRVRAQALPRPGRFVLRVEARGHGPPAVPGRPARRPAARAGRACGRAGATRRPRRRPAHVHDRHDHAERGDRRPARPDAGRHRRRTPGIAGWTRRRPIRASCSACWCRTRRSSSTSTPSTGTSTTSGATARS